MRSAPPIAFDARPSRALAAVSALGVVLAVIAPWQSALPTSARLGASLAALAIGIVGIRRFVRPRFERVACGALGWTLAAANSEPVSAELVAHRRLGVWLALDFRASDRRRFRVVLGPDNSNADTRRRLALMLARGEIARAAPPA